MSKTNKLANQIKGHFSEFEDNHERNMNGNKAAGSRARKAVGVAHLSRALKSGACPNLTSLYLGSE